jgi:Pentapeptide repeats (8 copies)
MREANLSNAKLHRASLCWAVLILTNLQKANLSKANLRAANFREANLREADLSKANLKEANLRETDLSKANLKEANLQRATLIRTVLKQADLTGALIHGIAAWNLQLKDTIQSDLVITDTNEDELAITVDNLEVAQFIYLLVNNQNIRHVIDTITSKVVLILGRFTPERKTALDELRNELRKHNYTPVLVDFEKPINRDLTETVSILAHMARFIIVDLTDPSSAPHEVATIIPQCVVPVQPLLSREPLVVDGKVVERHEYAMFEDLRRRYHWVLPTFHYHDTAELLASLQTQIIAPAEEKAKELTQPK